MPGGRAAVKGKAAGRAAFRDPHFLTSDLQPGGI
jgi:hypothetical protein